MPIGELRVSETVNEEKPLACGEGYAALWKEMNPGKAAWSRGLGSYDRSVEAKVVMEVTANPWPF